MLSYEYITKENIEKHNPNWAIIFNHLYKILINGDSRSGKTSVLVNLIKQQDDYNDSVINKIYLYVKDPSSTK